MPELDLGITHRGRSWHVCAPAAELVRDFAKIRSLLNPVEDPAHV